MSPPLVSVSASATGKLIDTSHRPGEPHSLDANAVAIAANTDAVATNIPNDTTVAVANTNAPGAGLDGVAVQAFR